MVPSVEKLAYQKKGNAICAGSNRYTSMLWCFPLHVFRRVKPGLYSLFRAGILHLYSNDLLCLKGMNMELGGCCWSGIKPVVELVVCLKGRVTLLSHALRRWLHDEAVSRRNSHFISQMCQRAFCNIHYYGLMKYKKQGDETRHSSIPLSFHIHSVICMSTRALQ